MNNWKGKIWGALIGLLIAGPFGVIVGGLIGHFLIDSKNKRISGKAWGGIIGMMFGGPLGAIAGVYLGHSIDQSRAGMAGLDERSMFQINLISILSYVVKADGKIAEEEIQAILGVFRKMGYGSRQMAVIQRTLAFALQQNIDFPTTCRNFKKASTYEERLMLLRIVYMIVMSDGVIHPKEKEAIFYIVEQLEISTQDYTSLQAEFLKSADQYYEVLGLRRGASKAEVKRAYRKLALTHHPDRVAHLGEEYKHIAKEKFQKISESYSKIIDELQTD